MDNTTRKITCPQGRECGACALLGVEYESQLQQKRDVLKQAIGKQQGLRDLRTLPCLPSPQLDHYRNRVKMAIGMSSRGGNRMGYFRSGTREIVDAPDCRVLVPELLETTCRIRTFLAASRKIPRTLRHIDLRCGSDPKRQHLILVFRATEMPNFPMDALRRKCPAIDGISVNLNPTKGPQVIKGSVQHLWGEREVWVDHAGLRLRISPAAFFQVNLKLLPEIHGLMESFFEGGDVLADLYCGVGTHGLALRNHFQQLFFAEGNRSAIADLKSTLRSKNLGNFIVSPVAVERGLSRLRDAGPDAIILNPSRAGAQESVLDAISQCPTKKIAYLSCDPATLCRDLEILRQKRFAIQSVQPIDMMPQTGQVEALALLTRSN